MSKMWNLDQFKDNLAVIDEYGMSLTYDQLNAEASALADVIGHRCLVFSLCRNEIGSVLGYTAFINNGIVPVIINSHLEELLLENLLEAYKPEYLWVPKDQKDQFSGMSVEHEAYDYALMKTNFKLIDQLLWKATAIIEPYGFSPGRFAII